MRQAVKRRLLNYRNTPHPSTGVAPAELMFRRNIRTRIPTIRKELQPETQLQKAKQRDSVSRQIRKAKLNLKGKLGR